MSLIRLLWMIFCVAWGLYHFMKFDNMPNSTQAEVNHVLWWAFLPYAIGRGILRELWFQSRD